MSISMKNHNVNLFNYPFRYDGGRITKNGIRDTDCGIKISDVKDADHGKWECSISAVNEVNFSLKITI
jgi:hypothetical protein